MSNDLIKELLLGVKQQAQDDLEILHLTAYDNCLSRTAKSLLSNELSQRYHLGTLESRNYLDPASMGEFLFKGMIHVDRFEKIASTRACEMFSASGSELRPLSGMHAMLSSVITLTRPGDVVYSIECDYGGHFGTKYVVENLGRKSATIPIDHSSLNIDIPLFEEKLRKVPADIIYFDIGCALFPIPLTKIRELVGSKTLIIYDASHTFGLISGGQFQAPLIEGADVLQGNTHKTFPGPQKAMMYFKDTKIEQKVSDGLSSGLVSSQHTHHSLALYLTILEMYHYGKDYAKQMIENAKALAVALIHENIELLGTEQGYTQSNVLLINGDSVGGHVDACRRLYQSNIATNSRHGYGKEVIRLGVQEVTRRGLKEKDMPVIAYLFKKILKDKVDPAQIKKEVIAFNKNFPQILYSFDESL